MTNNEIQAQLEQFSQDDSVHIRSRAQIILQTLEGKTPAEITSALNVSLPTVKKWQLAWTEQGMGIFPPIQVPDAVPVQTQTALTFGEPEPIQNTDSLAEAARKTLRAQLQQMIEMEPTARAGEDREGVHKMRVSTRRMRSAYRIFEDYLPDPYFKKIPKRLRGTAQALGSVRDLDVALIKIEKYIERDLKGDQTALEPLLALITARHQTARDALLHWLDSDDYQKLVQRLYKLVAEPLTDPATRVDHHLPMMIYKRLETVRGYEDQLANADYATLHSLRIEFKRLRYLLEFFSGVLGKPIGQVIQEIKNVQEHLGDLNDAVVAVDLIDSLIPHLPESQRSGARQYQTARQTEIEKLITTFPQAWEQFNRQELREALALAIAGL